MHWIKALLEEVAGPRVAAAVAAVYWNVIAPIFADPTFHWIFAASALVLALAHYLARRAGPMRAFLKYTFPREIWAHRSAKLDYKFFIVTQVVLGKLGIAKWVFGLVALLGVADRIRSLLVGAFGEWHATSAPPLLAAIVFTSCVAAAIDLGKFLSHYLHHRIPVLWEFHKVHHAAEVLTPFSAFRNHPIEQLIELAFRLLCAAPVVGAFAYFFPQGVTELTVASYGLLTFVFYLSTHLRHSHIPFDFGRLNRVFVSPVMHQFHHSACRQHFDKNFGVLFSWWDRIAGTAYFPRRDEPLTLGLGPDGERFDSTWALFLRPFARALSMLIRGPARSPTAEDQTAP